MRHFAHECRLFATFSETDTAVANPETPLDNVGFLYTRAEMEQFALQAGWGFRYIGEWATPETKS